MTATTVRKSWIARFKEACVEAGFYVDNYSPGDGVTRFRFFSEPSNYFTGDGDFTALGRREALIYAKGRGANIEGLRR